MREILFRGKHAWNEEWVEGWFVGKTCDSLFGPARGSAQIIDQDLLWHEVMPETVGQYTGLKDKNGKRIFEGDVVKMFYKDDFREIGPVMWSDIGARYKFAPPVGAAYNIDCTCVMEIVGNIHDNPELLKGEGK
ncbi:MAG: hypothetical protein E7590_07560 [Ruminococcaceae bacterium]|nr:hypothetical protein [Oscillospiraceae bacterium]